MNKEVAKRVQAIADDMGFTPNLAGKVLARRKQPLRIGCLLPSIGNPFFDDVIAGFRQAERELSDFGVVLDITQIKSFDLDVHLKELKHLEAKHYDGVCVTTLDVQPVINTIDRIAESGTTVVTVNTDIDSSHRLFFMWDLTTIWKVKRRVASCSYVGKHKKNVFSSLPVPST